MYRICLIIISPYCRINKLNVSVACISALIRNTQHWSKNWPNVPIFNTGDRVRTNNKQQYGNNEYLPHYVNTCLLRRISYYIHFYLSFDIICYLPRCSVVHHKVATITSSLSYSFHNWPDTVWILCRYMTNWSCDLLC